MPKSIPPKLEQLNPRDRNEWRQWLEKNHATSPGVQVVITKKNAGKAGIHLDEAVEEALCFGWIDSRANKRDEFSYRLHFSPRKPGGTWANANKQRVAKLIQMGLMTPAGLKVVEASRQDGSWNQLEEIDQLVIPEDLSQALSENPAAEKYFQAYSYSLKKQLLWWLKTSQRPETRAKRIAQIVAWAERNHVPV